MDVIENIWSVNHVSKFLNATVVISFLSAFIKLTVHQQFMKLHQAKIVGWLYWGLTHVFPGFLTPVLTQLFFPKTPTTFLICFAQVKEKSHQPGIELTTTRSRV